MNERRISATEIPRKELIILQVHSDYKLDLYERAFTR